MYACFVAASIERAAGVDVLIVSRALGHASVELTWNTYSHVLKGPAQKAAPG
jgi:hypothetical protein